MPDDVGDQPFSDGEGPESQDRGTADDAFAAVVLDERFVEAAAIHEPTAAERILYAALERAESEASSEPLFYAEPDLDPGTPEGIVGHGHSQGPGAAGFSVDDPEDEEGRFDRSDYTRYLPDEDDEEELAYGGYSSYGPPTGYAARSTAFSPSASWRMARWQRPVACVLAMVMGISVIALALIAIQRAGSAQRGEHGPPGPASPASGDPGGAPVVVEAEIPDGGS